MSKPKSVLAKEDLPTPCWPSITKRGLEMWIAFYSTKWMKTISYGASWPGDRRISSTLQRSAFQILPSPKKFQIFEIFCILLSITSCLITRILCIFECTQRILFIGIWIWIASNSMQKRQMKPFNPVIQVSLLAIIGEVLVSGTLPYC